MPMTARVRSLWRSLRNRTRLEAELDEELRAYFDELVERGVRAGASPAEARRAATLAMGSFDVVKDNVRDARVGNAVETTLQDVRMAWRGLRRSPGVAGVAILTLALGIGANTAIFSVVRAMLIAPLPYRDSSRLVFIWSDMTAAGYPRAPLSAPEVKDLRDRGTLFDGVGGIWATTASLSGDGDPEQLRIALVTTNFFQVLGADSAIGRTFAADDESQDAPRTILLSWALWQRRYGGDRSIVGRAIRVNGQTTTVIGVMPADFRLLLPPDSAVPDDLEAWQLLRPDALTRGPRGQQFLRVVARMKPDVTLAEARQQVDGIARQISREFTDYSSAPRVFTTVGLQADDVRQIQPTLLALLAGVGVLLVIACVNVAGLLVARAAARRRETAVRLSLGASRARLLRQCLVEGLVLAALGGAAGLLIARFGLDVLLALRPSTLVRLGSARIDGLVLGFTAFVGLGWGVLFSLAPLSEVLRADLAPALRQEGRQPSSHIRHELRAGIVVLQIALTVVLAVAAALMVRTFVAIQRIDPGFRDAAVMTFRIALPGARYGTPARFNEFGRRMQHALSALPGVTAVGSLSHLPFDSLPNWGGPYISTPGADESTAQFADHRAVTPGLFETIGVQLVEGRFFTEDDDQRSAPVVIVDDQLARHAWPGESAVGKRIAGDPASTGHPVFWATVVGVVRHVRHRSLLEDLNDEVFFAERQIQRNPMAYLVRTTGDPAALASSIRRSVAALDPQLPVYDVRPLREYVDGARAAQRFTMLLATIFAAVAIVLAGVGIYGVIAYTTTRRRYEFGIRMALGATPRQVVGLVLREGLVLAAIGLTAGAIVAAIAARWLDAELFGVSPADVPSFAVAALATGGAALFACWLPARRAAHVSAREALGGDTAA